MNHHYPSDLQNSYQILLKQALRTDFLSFMKKCFYTMHPHKDFSMNWHIQLISELLLQSQTGPPKRMIINLPPRHLKSFIINVVWPAWLLAQNPSCRIISASYSERLSLKHALDCRHILQSPWFQKFFPHCTIREDGNEKHKILTTAHGYRFATSVGGTLTGEGGDVIIVDDPQNACHIHSPKRRQAVIDWFEQSLITRLDDKAHGTIILVMQRLHPDDLTGHLMKKEHGWYQLTLPAIAYKKVVHNIGKLEINRHEGDILHPERESYEQLQELKKLVGFQNFEAQYQQSPIQTESHLIKKSWIQYYNNPPEDFEEIVQSWDTAMMTGESHDYSVCTTWGVTSSAFYLLDLFRGKLPFHELLQMFNSLSERWNPHGILLEASPQGHVIWQEIYRTTQIPLVKIIPKWDKLTRFTAIIPYLEGGKVWFPEKADWKDNLMEELMLFPSARHDDQVDSISQFLNFQRNKPPLPRIVRL